MKTLVFFFFFFFFIIINGFSQTTVSGKVTDPKGLPIEGANVYLEGSYDGGTTDVFGSI